ncbi:fungal specific transcription factor [Colletotrichum plurivorum]|uniref:Fungal specific transcription factor n=1 Tax=Colletotrichum plurivorum TaxID=2175906 RepID=A0A8H6JHQ3_9PEZI|nr:fungal specific transcription factor [Colletotrichum plurivorum]
MARRLQDAEKMIAQLRRGSPSAPTAHEAALLVDNNHAQSPEEQSSPDIALNSAEDVLEPVPDANINATNLDEFRSQNAPGHEGPLSREPAQNHPASDAPSNEQITTELSVDEHGKICYYGPTSAVHNPPELNTPVSLSSTCNSFSSPLNARDFLSFYSKKSSIWEGYALGNIALETGLPRQTLAKLLQIHWTWVSPMFMWVYRPAFMRDMATGGRYYSEFLLTVLCAHSAKYQDGLGVDLLLSRVRHLLGAAIQQPSSIPTVQALLQLSARELAQGSISQAWVYSGIAFRMASDLGLQHSGQDISGLKGLNPVDSEVGRRLFWSCYFWDNLYTGRLPAVNELPPLATLDMLNDIILQVYSRRSRPITEAALKDIKTRLDHWRAQSPPHLRYDPDDLPKVCPPPHIISQNLLYYTTVILAHRPFWSVASYYQACISAAKSIEKLLLLLEATFGLENITYLMGYCIYTGASAVLEDTNKGDPDASAAMHTYLRALNTGMKRCPLLERSLNIIIKSLKSAPVRPSLIDHPPPLHDALPSKSYIPAFPYLDPLGYSGFDMDSHNTGDANFDALAMLDCFPELQIDFGELICAGG